MSEAKESYYERNKNHRWEKQKINSYITDYVTELEKENSELKEEIKRLKNDIMEIEMGEHL